MHKSNGEQGSAQDAHSRHLGVCEFIRHPKQKDEGEAAGVSWTGPLRFLGIDADNGAAVVWVFSCEWTEDGFPCTRIMRFKDAVLAKADVQGMTLAEVEKIVKGKVR